MERDASSSDFMERAGNHTYLDILRVEKEAARLQAEVNAQVMTALVGGLGKAIRWTAAAIARFLREQWVGVAAYRVHNELKRLSDSQLARLGISREEIPSFFASLVAPKPADQPAALHAIAGDRVANDTQKHEEPARRRAA